MQEIIIDKIEHMPEQYKNCINYVIKHAKKIYKENLSCIFLAGSGGKGNILENWSDLDLYFITNKFDMEANFKVYSNIKDNAFGIHVGTTFYTKDMVKNLNVDSKTLVAFYEYTNLNLNYFIYNSIEINKVSLDDIIYSKREVNDLIQVVNREYNSFILSQNNFKTLIKKITLLVKVYMIKKYNIFTYGYNNVFREINKVINIENIIRMKKINEYEIKYFSDIINIVMEGMK